MGFQYCNNCGNKGFEEMVSYSCCQKFQEAEWCEKCEKAERRKTCAECGDEFCENHGTFEKHTCCGNYFCNGYDIGDDDEEEQCHSKHIISLREECGHLICNYQEEECKVCEVEADIEQVKELKEHCMSASLKRYLECWLEESEKVIEDLTWMKESEEEESSSEEEEYSEGKESSSEEEEESSSEEEEKSEAPKKKAKISNPQEIIVIDD